jgi:hypothetical protein
LVVGGSWFVVNRNHQSRVLDRSADAVQRRARSLIPWRRPPEPLTAGCDPAMFTDVVVNYLSVPGTKFTPWVG